MGAVGIAVRAIAPHCKSKAADPAVVVVDEGGNFAVPLLSGHLGGANALARALAGICGVGAGHHDGHRRTRRFCRGRVGQAPELRRGRAGAHPLREWGTAGRAERLLCRRLGCFRHAARRVWEPAAAADRADFALTLTPTGEALHLIPRIAVLGVGCKRGTTAEKLETAFAAFCAEHHFAPQGIVRAASIDLKKDEPGLAAFCQAHDWKMDFYTAAALRTAKGRFTSSGFVQSITGVDNVCERAAVLAADGVLFIPKWARDGVTLAVALAPFAPDWRWKNDEP